MRLGNNPPGQTQVQRESAKRGTQVTFPPTILFFFPFTRGVGVKNLDALSFLNGVIASGR